MGKKTFPVSLGGRAGVREIVHGAFIREGAMVAVPLCFPGASTPIPPDESHVTALAVGPDDVVYGGTSGRAVHLFAGLFRGATGAVFDMGGIQDARQCVAVACAGERVIGCVNDDNQGWVVTHSLQPPPFDLLQEWGFSRSPFKILQPPVPGERILHAVALPDGNSVLGLTPRTLFELDVAAGEVRRAVCVPGRGRLVVVGDGTVLGPDRGARLWRRDASGEIDREAVRLPGEAWRKTPASWAYSRACACAWTADDEGRIVAIPDGATEGAVVARAPLQPVGPMAATPDGRLFGTCGRGIANFFRLDPGADEAHNLGAAVSVLERRRYGYEFAAAAVGSDGEIFWGEDDDLGHLWIYFPANPAVAPHRPGR
ncbi:MAG: hypothetical protein GXP31_13200 [Kiritimatiellaeota bacterium]|nr:hypothetical protein [Kiritimatiellota bacterium]